MAGNVSAPSCHPGLAPLLSGSGDRGLRADGRGQGRAVSPPFGAEPSNA